MKNDAPWFSKFTHDVRSKLNGVIGLSQILQEENLTEEQKAHIDGILKCGNDLLIMIDEKKREISADNASSEASSKVVADANAGFQVEQMCQLANGRLILVVDDEAESRNVLTHSLTKAGYTVMSAATGEEALKDLENARPEIILLDVMMPGVDGYHVCQQIRQREHFGDIPILFLSGVAELQGRLKAYSAGGTDYILKPFFVPEVIARVNTQVALLESKKELKKYALSLEKLVQEKTEQLLHADRMVNLGIMSAGVAHEINNPLTFVKGNVDLLWKFLKEIELVLGSSEKKIEPSKKIAFIRKEFPNALKEMGIGLERIGAIVSGLKTFARQDNSKKEPTNVRYCIEEALMLVRSELKNKVMVENKVTADLPLIDANPSQIIQIFVNLFINAKHAMAERKQATLRIEAEVNLRSLTIQVADNGCGMDESTMQKIWHPFFTTKAKGVGTGLGLSIVHGIVLDHKGEIAVQSEIGKGTTFILGFPIPEKKKG